MSSIRCHCVFFTHAFLAFGCAGASDANDAGTGGTGTAGASGTSTAGAGGTSTAGAGGTSTADAGGTTSTGGAKGGTAGTNDGVPTQAGSGGANGSAGNMAAAGTISGSAGAAGAAGGPSTSFEDACLADAADACERCLCSECSEQVEACANTAGCPEIAECIRQSQCRGVDCYCGSVDALACAGGQGNGPCKAVILDAPGGREPSLLSPSAGPASDAAVAISTCAEEGQPCAEACSFE